MRKFFGWLRDKLPLLLNGASLVERYGSSQLFPFFFIPLKNTDDLGNDMYTFTILRGGSGFSTLLTHTAPIAEFRVVQSPSNSDNTPPAGRVFLEFLTTDLTKAELIALTSIRDTIEPFLMSIEETRFFGDERMLSFTAKSAFMALEIIEPTDEMYEQFVASLNE